MTDNIVYEGLRLRIRWAIQRTGRMTAAEYFKELPDLKKAQLLILFERLDNERQIKNPHQFEKLEDGLFEFKRLSSQVRMICFYSKCGSIVITHGFTKKTKGPTPREQKKDAEKE